MNYFITASMRSGTILRDEVGSEGSLTASPNTINGPDYNVTEEESRDAVDFFRESCSSFQPGNRLSPILNWYKFES